MAFEELDQETTNFFKNGGELDISDLGEGEVVPDPVDPVEQIKELVPEVVTKVESATQEPNNTYLERLLEERTLQAQELARRLEQLTKDKDAPVAPDQQTDPLGYMAYKIEQGQVEIAELKEALVNQMTAQNSQVATTEYMKNVEVQVQNFIKAQPDYPEAYKYLVELRSEEYKLRGITGAAAERALSEEQIQITNSALKSGKNVGELVYNLAKKYGYKQPEEQKSKLDVIKSGVETAGVTYEKAVPQVDISAASIKNMSDKELNALVKDDNAWARLMGHSGGSGIF